MEETFVYPDVFTTSTSTENIIKALISFNDTMGVIGKDSENPFFKSRYAPLPDILKAIKAPLVNAGLTINHFPVGDNRLVTRLSHSTGEFFQSMSYMRSGKDTPQDRGSLITYMMRYGVGSVLGLAIDKDDDGNSASMHPVVKEDGGVKKTMTAIARDAMLKYIEEGKIDSVERNLHKYASNGNKIQVSEAIKKAKKQ